MKMVYISHPYTGDEENNMVKAEVITRQLSEMFPSMVFINPLNTMKHLQDTELSYDQILAQCLELMNRCDIMVMARGWEFSRGCVEEHRNAKIPVIEYDIEKQLSLLN